jgi:hypothetical protein
MIDGRIIFKKIVFIILRQLFCREIVLFRKPSATTASRMIAP